MGFDVMAELNNKLKVRGLSDKITIRELGVETVKLKDINSFSWINDKIEFLKDHEKYGDKLDWIKTKFYQQMIHHPNKSHEVCIQGIRHLLELYNSIKTEGWREGTYISIARIPYELFPIISTVGLTNLFSCEFPPNDLSVPWYKCANYSIDGGHRCAIQKALGKENIKAKIFLLEQKDKHWYQRKDELLSGNVPSRYRDIEKIVSVLVKDKVVIDIGCNAGLVSLLCKKYGAKKVYGLDLSGLFIQQAKLVENTWIKKGIIKNDDRLEFVKEDILDRLDLIEESDVFIFIRSIYYIGNWIDVRFDMDNSIDKIFEIVKKKKNAIVLLQGNWRRKEAVERARGKYGNKLSTIPGMIDLLTDYGMEVFIIDRAEHIVIAVNKECDESIKEKIFGLVKQ